MCATRRTPRLAGAAQAAGRSARLQPGDANSVLMQGDYLTRLGPHDAAIRAIVATAPNDPRLHGRLGETLLRTGVFAGAEAAYRQAIALDPNALWFQGGLAEALDGLGRRAEAIAVVRAALATGRADSHMQTRLAWRLAKEGQVGEAEADHRRAIAMDQSVAGFHLALHVILDWQGRRAGAVDVLRDALDGGADDPLIASRLTELIARGDSASATSN